MSSMPSTAQLYAIFKRDVHKFTKWCQIYQLFSSHLPDEVQTLYQLALVKQLQQGQGRDQLITGQYQQLVIQFIKQTCDYQQRDISAHDRLPVAVIAQKQGIDRVVVDVRNQIAHGANLGGQIYQQCTSVIERWLEQRYETEGPPMRVPASSMFDDPNPQTVNRLLCLFAQTLRQALCEEPIDGLRDFVRALVRHESDLHDEGLRRYLLGGVSHILDAALAQMDIKRFRSFVFQLRATRFDILGNDGDSGPGQLINRLLDLLVVRGVRTGNVYNYLLGTASVRPVSSSIALVRYLGGGAALLAYEHFRHDQSASSGFYGIDFDYFHKISSQNAVNEPHETRFELPSLAELGQEYDTVLVGRKAVKAYLQGTME